MVIAMDVGFIKLGVDC